MTTEIKAEKKQFRRGVDFELDVYPVPKGAEPDDDEVTALMGRVMPLHDQVLNLAKPRTVAEVIRNVIRATEVVFAHTLEVEPKDIAVIVQSIKTVTIGGQPLRAVDVKMRGVLTEFQNHGIGTVFTIDAIERHDPDGFTGRTPNPNIFRVYRRVDEIGKITPIDGPYTTELQNYMAALLSPAELETTDLSSGRCFKVYPAGAERLVIYDPNDREMMEMLRIMTGPRVGAKLEEGDGVRYWAERLNGPRGRGTHPHFV